MLFHSWRGVVGVVKPTYRPGSLEEFNAGKTATTSPATVPNLLERNTSRTSARPTICWRSWIMRVRALAPSRRCWRGRWCRAGGVDRIPWPRWRGGADWHRPRR